MNSPEHPMTPQPTNPVTNRAAACRSPLPPLKRRDIRFDFAGVLPCDWHPSGRHVTHFFNALSLLFPNDEKFFIECVIRYLDRVGDPRLVEDVKGFTGQEATHGREHRVYNALLAQAGYDVERLVIKAEASNDAARRWLPPLGRLACTVAGEHIVATLADALLSDDRVLAGADPRMASLWCWHAMEETEHKAVAFDVYRAASGGGLRGYCVRSFLMLVVTAHVLARTLHNYVSLLRHDGLHRDWRGWRSACKFLWISPGPLRRSVGLWLWYFLPGFHPWRHDNRRYVERWNAAYAATGQPPAVI